MATLVSFVLNVHSSTTVLGMLVCSWFQVLMSYQSVISEKNLGSHFSVVLEPDGPFLFISWYARSLEASGWTSS